MRLMDVKAFARSNLIMIDVRAHNMTMERDSIMITLKKLNQASLELHNSSFENIKGED
jgi:hypothetical protein